MNAFFASHRRRVAAEAGLLIGLGLVMAEIGPYATDEVKGTVRVVYWLVCIGGGGAIGVGVDTLVGRRTPTFWTRIACTTLAMTPLVSLFVWAVSAVLLTPRLQPRLSLGFLVQVFVISLLVMILRALFWRGPVTVVETKIVVEPPLPQAEERFRRRLTAKRRHARLLAVQAEDHYLRVYTDAGDELLTLRFSEALQDLSAAHGFQVHRSWWVAAEAIENVHWRKNAGEVRLIGGLAAPVSRTRADALKEAGWF